MKDILIPLGLLLFIGLFVYSFIHSTRKQRQAKSGVFSDFANRNGLRYRQEDDGMAVRFAQDLDGIGRFTSPSLGKVIPEDVVTGKLDGTAVILFRHRIRFSEGWAREWFVAGVTSAETIAQRCAIQFSKGKADKSTIYLQDPVVKEQEAGSYTLVVRAADPTSAGRAMDPGVLKRLADLAGNVPFRPEIQIRGKRLVAYPADRNATVDDVETLEKLVQFTKSAASV